MLLFAFLLIGIIACESSPGSRAQPMTSLTTSSYKYVGLDTAGVQVASGSLTLVITDTIISGQKDIQQIGSKTQIEAGTGAISGIIPAHGQVNIYLYETPGPFLYITGTIAHDRYGGNRVTGSNTAIDVQIVGTFVITKVE